MLTTIILTYNEELHIERCLNSISKVSSQIIIIDSFSNDNTLKIAKNFNSEIYQHKFLTQSDQLIWALDNCKINSEWILRLDADEYLTNSLVIEITNNLHQLKKDITGIFLKRRLYFMGKWIKHGGYYPTYILRIWKKNIGYIEAKNMDEHIKLKYGQTYTFKNDFIDENLSGLSTWSIKHINYAQRETLDFYNNINNITRKKLYYQIPIFLRSFVFFIYRYFSKLNI